MTIRKFDTISRSDISDAEIMKNKPTLADALFMTFTILVVMGIAGKIDHSFEKKIQQSSIKPAPVIRVVDASVMKPTVAPTDQRTLKLMKFLLDKKSPFAYLAGYIVELSDKNGLDYTLIVSISGIESSYGVNTKQSCHNPFGLGGTSLMCFSSWDKAIEYEADLLSKDYRWNIAKGIQTKYCPDSECNPEWATKVEASAREILQTEGGE